MRGGRTGRERRTRSRRGLSRARKYTPPSLAQRIEVDPTPDAEPRARIFCMIYTYHKNHEKASASRDTWLPRCDGAVIASDLDDAAIGAVNIPHEGPEEWKNIWQKCATRGETAPGRGQRRARSA